VSQDIFSLVQAFYNNQLNLSKLNHACIVLIPKVAEANSINQFRPISLINCSFKIITKILACRLARILDKLIGPTQTTFISAQETLYQVKKSKEK
jgi:Reverse transcriptase (RNA-dependent DNA polymerase)